MSKVIVGLSGGVDSAVAALLLIKQGYEVTAVTMTNKMTNASETEDAKKIADKLGIKHIEIDMQKEFKEEVIDYFVSEYLHARTPNPCIMCNPKVKFESLLRVMETENADYIATGHYAEIKKLNNERYTISVNEFGKDQTYALCRLSQKQLEHLLTPLATYTKDEVRELACEAGLFVAGKKDSQDICFVQNGKYFEFIKKYCENIVTDKPGNFVDESGNVLGTHRGLSHYTVGQRKKLGLSLNKPVFVKELRLLSNEIVISTQGDVYQNYLYCTDLNVMADREAEDEVRLFAKIRYAHEGTYCRLRYEKSETDSSDINSRYNVIFEEPVRAVTPGQAIVFYKDGYVYASAIICG